MRKRKTYSADTKARAVLTLVRGEKTAVELAQELGCHPNMLAKWRDHLEKEAASVFETDNQQHAFKEEKAKLERLIGKLTVQNDFLERVSGRLD
jgi:transposase